MVFFQWNNQYSSGIPKAAIYGSVFGVSSDVDHGAYKHL